MAMLRRRPSVQVPSGPRVFPAAMIPGVLLVLCALGADAQTGSDLSALRTGEQVYRAACQACHGPDGRGMPQSLVGFDTPLPDFTDCSFATREPNGDWIAVAHQGGPVRSFSALMPAFGAALTVAQLESAVNHIRGFCLSDEWPRGEFNLPRPLVTGKAYLEDETVLTSTVDSAGGGPDAFMNRLTYEKRFGARNQFEAVLPFGWRDLPGSGMDGGGDTRSGIGDLVLGLKRALYDDLGAGTLVSISGELALPTGDEVFGFGKGTAVFEPALLYAKLLPADFFLQAQLGAELPFDDDKASEEAFWRAAVGKTYASQTWGRSWTPMLEVLGARDLVSGAETHWDLVPQLQVSLSKRQHILLNMGVRIPANNTDARDPQFMIYLLWDWFDGGLTEGW